MNDEARLVQQARTDARAFGQHYDRYVDRIFAYAQRELGDVAAAEDVVSATFATSSLWHEDEPAAGLRFSVCRLHDR